MDEETEDKVKQRVRIAVEVEMDEVNMAKGQTVGAAAVLAAVDVLNALGRVTETSVNSTRRRRFVRTYTASRRKSEPAGPVN